MEEEARSETFGDDYWDVVASETKGKDVEDFWRGSP
jgi:hypothetical protein